MPTLTPEDINGMVGHWLSVRPNGYLGSPYGADAKSLLQNPQSTSLADAFIDKMMEDIPVLQQMPPDAINVYFNEVSKEEKQLIIQVLDQIIVYQDFQ